MPLARAGTQYNATTCPARAGLIPSPAPTHWGRGHPPRMRRDVPSSGPSWSGPRAIGRSRAGRRIISACAERSTSSCRTATPSRDHLRVCGADMVTPYRVSVTTGSPPRVRSRRTFACPVQRRGGITSACAEQTGISAVRTCSPGDHLRVCGADSNTKPPLTSCAGSPPRVRSRPLEPQVERGV